MIYLGRMKGKGTINRKGVKAFLQSKEIEQLTLDVANRLIEGERKRYYYTKVVIPVSVGKHGPDRVAVQIRMRDDLSDGRRIRLIMSKDMALIVGRRVRVLKTSTTKKREENKSRKKYTTKKKV